MISLSSLLTVMLLAAIAPAQPKEGGSELAVVGITVRQRVVVRVPMPRRHAPNVSRWKEHKGPRCIPLASIGGAAVTAPDSVDLILRGGTRIRAELESACPALDFYSGFYLVPSEGDRICADRDSIHARSGGECGIERFRKLVPVPAH